MKNKFIIFTILIFTQSLFAVDEILQTNIEKHVKFLASDELGGRLTGSVEGEIAARYIATEFESYGLEPLKDGSFLEPFEFAAPPKIGEFNRFEIQDKNQKLVIQKDFVPISFSNNDIVESEIVFVGYGVKSDARNSYKNIKVKDKIVMVLRGLPYNFPDSLQSLAALHYKSSEAREQGAKGIIYVTGYHNIDVLSDLVRFRPYNKNKDNAISAISISQKVAESILKKSKKSLKKLEDSLEKGSNSFVIKKSKVIIQTDLIRKNNLASNVVGIVKGTTKPNEAILIGGHYDHLGFGHFSSLSPNHVGEVHNGADDNASGTAGVLELARYFAQNPTERSIIFMAFSGEEMGLLGSKAWLKNSSFAKEKISAMFNMDMIGRLEENKLIVNGVGTSEIWESELNSRSEEYKLKLFLTKDGSGPSDYSSFYEENIPVLSFFTGVHEDYHTFEDDTEKLNFEGQFRTLKFIGEMLEFAGNYENDIPFTKYKSNDPHSGIAKTGFRVYVGTIPDYSYEGNEGMKLSGAKSGGPADKAGMQKGDFIISFNKREVKNIYDFMYAIQDCKPNKTVPAQIKRDGKILDLQVTPINKKQ
ncbi:MAG: M20/M25/M40 family metallo-hydrolase [Calditrichaeota bacterium]|nr:MAG: M20/M25/M40 family metallo-hydrolase [Calditrichota bacterium]